MRRCFALAQHGRGFVAPNPLVGSVLVARGEIIGEGWHRQYGHAHAEVNAIASVRDTSLLKEATLYVNLEPCAHYGKTPPCANLIVEKGIPHVVVANRDPFDAVNGKGIEHLRKHGVHVEVGIGEDEGRVLNAHFFTFHEQKRPYIVLKWAQTERGFIAPIHPKNASVSGWISHPATRKIVHQWRAEIPAILVGWRTVASDNPELTVRDVDGRSPLRAVLDPNNRLSGPYRTFNGDAPSLVFSKRKPDLDGHFDWIQWTDDGLDGVMHALYERQCTALLVEGGAATLNAFIESDLWDEARIITGRSEFNDGVPAPAIDGRLVQVSNFAGDRIAQYKRV